MEAPYASRSHIPRFRLARDLERCPLLAHVPDVKLTVPGKQRQLPLLARFWLLKNQIARKTIGA